MNLKGDKVIKFIQLENKDIKSLREKLYNLNNGICPILKIEIPFEKTTLDHIHKLKNEEISIDKGCCRNAIDNRANQLEGRITSMWKRYFGSDESKYPLTLPEFLRNLADYLEKGSYFEDDGIDKTYFIHPSEKPLPKYVKKSCFNKLKKVCNTKLPTFKDKKQKLTKELKRIFNKYNIEIEYYS